MSVAEGETNETNASSSQHDVRHKTKPGSQVTRSVKTAARGEAGSDKNSGTAVGSVSEINGTPRGFNNSVRSADYDRHRPFSAGDRDGFERPKNAPMEVSVDTNIEKAMRVLKRKLIKEGLFKELKARRYYEKPSEKRNRKHKESIKKIRKDDLRAKKNSALFS